MMSWNVCGEIGSHRGRNFSPGSACAWRGSAGKPAAPLRIFVAPPPAEMEYTYHFVVSSSLNTSLLLRKRDIPHMDLSIVALVQFHTAPQMRERQVEEKLIAHSSGIGLIHPGPRL